MDNINKDVIESLKYTRVSTSDSQYTEVSSNVRCKSIKVLRPTRSYTPLTEYPITIHPQRGEYHEI